MKRFQLLCVLLAAATRVVFSESEPQTVVQLTASNEVCFLEKDAGRCRGLFARFFWNVDTQQCKVFAYGGCRGNGNNFQTALECQETCDPASVATPAPATTKPLHTTDSIETTSANSWNTSGWGPWRKWRQCYPSPVEEAPSCGPLSGQQKRVRRCLINGRCKGARNLLRSCEFRKCKPVIVYQPWSPCSTTCGIGVRYRRQDCVPPSNTSSKCGLTVHETCKVASCQATKQNRNICDRKPCRNGGECALIGLRRFRCHCLEGSYGPVCQFSRPGFTPPARKVSTPRLRVTSIPRPATEQLSTTTTQSASTTMLPTTTTGQPSSAPEPVKTAAGESWTDCLPLCSDGTGCLSYSSFCDGTADCADGSDERHCSFSFVQSNNSSQCTPAQIESCGEGAVCIINRSSSRGTCFCRPGHEKIDGICMKREPCSTERVKFSGVLRCLDTPVEYSQLPIAPPRCLKKLNSLYKRRTLPKLTCNLVPFVPVHHRLNGTCHRPNGTTLVVISPMPGRMSDNCGVTRDPIHPWNSAQISASIKKFSPTLPRLPRCIDSTNTVGVAIGKLSASGVFHISSLEVMHNSVFLGLQLEGCL